MVERLTVRTARGDFAVMAWGPEGGDFVLCLHGFPDAPRSFSALGERLGREGFRVVAPYLRGHFPSPLVGPFGLQALADDALALAQALAGTHGRAVHLVAHDLGGLAAYVALEQPGRRFRSATVLGVPHPRALLRNARRSLLQSRRAAYLALFQAGGLSAWLVKRRDFASVDRMWTAASPGYTPPPRHLREVKRVLQASWPAPLRHFRAAGLLPRGPDAAHIATPTQHLHGDRDGRVLPDMAEGQERFFRGRFVTFVVEGAGHFVHLERPDVVAERVLAWTGPPARPMGRVRRPEPAHP